jgi:hypothetical protein
MAEPVADFLVMQGHQAPPANATPGFTRLYGANPQQYVELNQFDIQPGSGPFQDGAMASYSIAVESRLVPDGYPIPVGAPPPPGPIKRIVEIPHPPVPLRPTGSDGTPLTPITDPASGETVGYKGTSKAGIQYTLSIAPSVSKGAGRTAAIVQWYNATMTVTSGGDAANPLSFGFRYCPWDNLLDLFLSRKNVDATIRIDLVPAPTKLQLEAQPGLIPSMDAYRAITIDGYLYSLQAVTVDDTQVDPQLYLPVVATFWPYLDGFGYFAPAIESTAASAANGLANVPLPISNFANLSVVFPVTEQNFVAAVMAAIGPALGPFLASFISPKEAPAAPLADAIIWLAAMSVQGVGKPDFLQEMDYFYNQAAEWIREGKENSPNWSAPILYVRGLQWSQNPIPPPEDDHIH